MAMRCKLPALLAVLLGALAFGCDSRARAARGPGPEANPSASVSRWTAEIGDARPEIRVAAVRALGSAGPEAKVAVPALLRVIDEDELRLEVIRALAAIGPEAKMAIPALIEALRDGDRDVRAGAGAALSRMGVEAVPALIAAVPSRSRATASAGEKESVIEELIRRRPEEVLTASVIVILAALAATVWITQLKIRHRERLAAMEVSLVPTTTALPLTTTSAPPACAPASRSPVSRPTLNS